MPDTTPDLPSVAEIAALTTRLRALSDAGRHADRAEVARVLADKDQLIVRIAAETDPPPSTSRREQVRAAYAAEDVLREVAGLRAAHGGYALVGPSARTWHTDPDGRPTVPASDAEHRAVRDLLQTEQLDTTAPTWIDAGGGQSEIVSTVVAPAAADDADRTDGPADVAPGEDADHLTPGSPAWTGDPWADYRTYDREEAAAELVARGVPPDQAPGVVERYLDGLRWDGRSRQDQWEIDDDDLDVMLDPPARIWDDPRPEDSTAGNDATAAEASGTRDARPSSPTDAPAREEPGADRRHRAPGGGLGRDRDTSLPCRPGYVRPAGGGSRYPSCLGYPDDQPGSEQEHREQLHRYDCCPTTGDAADERRDDADGDQR